MYQRLDRLPAARRLADRRPVRHRSVPPHQRTDGTPEGHDATSAHQPVAGHEEGHGGGDTAAQSTFPQYLTFWFRVIAALLSWYAFFDVAYGEHTYKVEVMRWIHSGGLAADWTLRVDTLTAVMLVVVTTVSSLVHIYSIGYMEPRSAPGAASSASCHSSPSRC